MRGYRAPTRLDEAGHGASQGSGPSSLPNLLHTEIDFDVQETRRGVWKRFVYPTGELYAEFTSHDGMFGLPWLHYTRGRNPETGRRKVAKGIVAVGRIAMGVIALGQLALGGLALGQLAVGLWALGQFGIGGDVVGQVALAVSHGLGQIATGQVAVGQVGVGNYVLAQLGIGRHVWDTRGIDPAAREYFGPFVDEVLRLLGA